MCHDLQKRLNFFKCSYCLFCSFWQELYRYQPYQSTRTVLRLPDTFSRLVQFCCLLKYLTYDPVLVYTKLWCIRQNESEVGSNMLLVSEVLFHLRVRDENQNLAQKLTRVVTLEFKYFKKYQLFNNKPYSIRKLKVQRLF